VLLGMSKALTKKRLFCAFIPQGKLEEEFF
jgi:hypothetical protein